MALFLQLSEGKTEAESDVSEAREITFLVQKKKKKPKTLTPLPFPLRQLTIVCHTSLLPRAYLEEWNSVQTQKTFYLNWWWKSWGEFQKDGRITWKHILLYFSMCQSQVQLQEKEMGHFLHLLHHARILENFNSEEGDFLKSIFMYPDLNCCPGNPIRTEYRSYFNSSFPT